MAWVCYRDILPEAFAGGFHPREWNLPASLATGIAECPPDTRAQSLRAWFPFRFALTCASTGVSFREPCGTCGVFDTPSYCSELYHLAMRMSICYPVAIDRHTIKPTTVRLEPQDKQAIEAIKELYGCPSDVAAIRLAIRVLARREIVPSTPLPQGTRLLSP